ncbi:MAG TPA: ABC transporter ATP-binding protein [Stellaceae bacterium]|nr:ABC transporter ATP-binding protein [Stellaceae bacterium]
MIAQKIIGYVNFGRRCIHALAEEKGLFALFLVLSVIGAFTEGITVSLVVPILETQGSGGFTNIPLLGDISAFFSGYTPGRRIEIVAVALAGIVVLRNALQYAIAVCGSVIPIRLERKLNVRSFESMMAVEIAYINQKEFGFLLSTAEGWTQATASMFTSLADVLSNGLVVTVYMVLMLAVSWKLTMLATVFLIAASLLLRWISSGPLRNAGERLTTAISRANQTMIQSMMGMKLVRLATAEPQMVRAYADAVGEMASQRIRSTSIFALNGPLLSTMGGLFIAFLLFANAAVHSQDSVAWVAPVLVFFFLMFRLMTPISTINTARARIVNNIPFFDALDSFYAEASGRRQPNGVRPADGLRRSIRFENVGFMYAGDGDRAIHDLSLTIDRGKMTAIVGPSGAGKTTLIALIARLYDPQNGRITVDDVDLRNFDIRSWRRRIAVVTQDTIIFNDTAARNIAFGREHVAIGEIQAAARLAAADEFIEQLPQGYDTPLGDRGVRLSGGQQQRISIARAILANPDLLIFDEATSNLDTFTERAIQRAIETLSQDRTVLVIAHRLSTVRRADKVLVMEAGRIVEEGGHDELIARGGRYRDMVEHQRLDLVSEDGALGARAQA